MTRRRRHRIPVEPPADVVALFEAQYELKRCLAGSQPSPQAKLELLQFAVAVSALADGLGNE